MIVKAKEEVKRLERRLGVFEQRSSRKRRRKLLDLEMESAVSKPVAKQDDRLSQLQNLVGASFAAIGNAISLMLKEEEAPHYHPSQQLKGADRRSLVTPKGGNSSQKDGEILTNTGFARLAIPFVRTPRQGVLPKRINWSSKELELLQASVSKLLEMGAISEVRPLFNRVVERFQVPKIDLFVIRINIKCKIFVSWLRDPKAYAVDAFTSDWKRFFFYVFFLFILSLRVLQKIVKDGAKGYDYTWDPAVVSGHFKLQDNGSISLERLSCKLATLLALATGQRVQTLTNKEIINIVKFVNRVEIEIPMRINTYGKNKLQTWLSLPFYDEEPGVCVARTIFIYLKRARNLRISRDCDRVLLTFRKLYDNASTQSIGRSIKKVLKASGIDTIHFSSCSTRHAGTSAVARKGLIIDTIRLTAG
ncbi:hypothetical protein ILUMI_18992 [Ignelater luminosus]|uniref:Uncharacterized protein n=1 Tax=Ignelater luminosus TaxID=2038154 RepID=A0A8K0CK70_IGNLU|nr:hypothetical protein ILUMI_18992 [Ignelater luminosus]